MIDACRLRREERYKACVDDVPLDRPKTTGKEHSSMKKELGDGLFRLLAPSVAGLLACVVCLCATSWAWFSTSVTAAATIIRSASYTVSVTVRQGETPVEVNEEAGVYSVKFLTDGEYTVTLALTPESTATKGYCIVKYNETPYYTDQLTTGSLSFTVTAAAETTLTITPTWGEYTGSESKPLAELSLPTNDPVETDQPESDVEPVEPPTTDEPKDEEQGQTPEENSGTEAPETPTEPAPDPATDNTPAEGETDSNSGDPETTPDASAPETPVPDPTPSDTPAPTPTESEN